MKCQLAYLSFFVVCWFYFKGSNPAESPMYIVSAQLVENDSIEDVCEV